MTDLFTKQVHVYSIYFILKWSTCCQCFLEVLPALDDHFKLSLSHSSALRMAMLMYLLTLSSPPCKWRWHSIDLSSFAFFVKNVCIKKPCPSNAICQAGFSFEGYRCVCVPGYTGEYCTEGEADISVQYLSVSSYFMIRKVGDRYFKWILVIGRKAFIKKGISLLPLLAMETVMNPPCNAFLSVARRIYRSWRCDFFQ